MSTSFKASSLNELKKELSRKDQKALVELCLKIAKYKKENKELLTYLLFEENDEQAFIQKVKAQIDQQYKELYRGHLFQTYKGLRKILRFTTKHIKYSGLKETEVELLLYYCLQLKNAGIRMDKSQSILNLWDKQLQKIKKAMQGLHEDLQYDYQQELEKLL